MNPQFKQWLTANGFDPEIVASNESQSQFLEAAWKTETQPPAALGGDGVSLDDLQAQIADMRREHQIARICGSEFANIQAEAQKEDWSVELVEAKVETARQKQKLEAGFAMPQIHAAGDGSDGPNPATVMEASLCIAGVLSEEEAGGYFDERTMNAAVGSDFRGFGLADLMFASIAAAGTAIRAGSVTDEVIRAAMTADRRQIEAGFSTLSFSGILSNVANKRLLKAYQSIASVIDQIAALRDVPDFKQVTSYSLAADGSFQEVGPDGELKHIGLKDTGYTNQAKTEGAIIALTRTMMINDDLGAFLKIPALLGRQAPLAKERAGFKCLLDNTGDFFHADNNNYETGADTALSIGSLSTGTDEEADEAFAHAGATHKARMKDIDDETAKRQKANNAEFNALDKRIDENYDREMAAVGKAHTEKTAAIDAELKETRAKWEKALAEAAARRSEMVIEGDEGPGHLEGPQALLDKIKTLASDLKYNLKVGGAAGSATGTFGAMMLGGLGAGSTDARKLKAAEATAKNTKDIKRKLDQGPRFAR